MKKIYILLFLFPLLFAATSCDSWEELNTDPDNPSDVPNSLLLPSAQASYAFGVGGDASRYSGVLAQHYVGCCRQFALYNNYIFNGADFDNMWRFNIYGGPLNDLQLMITKANTEGSPHYSGVAKILSAMILGSATDLFGDIPYSQAFQGSENLQPAYDSQETIYGTINTLLNEGISEIGQETSTLSPGADDLFYGGDLELWGRLANGAKARMAIHKSKRDGGAAAAEALAAVANGLQGNAHNAAIKFGASATEANPWFQYIDQRDDITYDDGQTFQLLNGTADPRFGAYFLPVLDDDGNTAFHTMNTLFGGIDAAVPLFTYAEQKFIEAEAIKIQGGAAREAYIAGITASMEYAGVDGTDYIATLEGEPTMEDIMTQKYIAMFTQPESYTDWRRTNIPALSPNNGPDIPRRLLYPETETNYNSANVPNATLFSRLWWDQ